MKPLFTVHAGEFLVGDYISRKLKRQFDVWLPVRDTGVDLLVTPRGKPSHRKQPVRIQVKFSRGFGDRLKHPEFLARGWYTLQPAKIRKSEADFWVFVILALRQEPIFVVVPLRELRRRIPKLSPRIWHLYLTVYENKRCFNTRGMKRHELTCALTDGVADPRCDYANYLENWKLLEQFSGA